MIEKLPLLYERTHGKEYGSIEGGVHYENLGLISAPLKQMLHGNGAVRIGDFGGGSGIVGLHAISEVAGRFNAAVLDVLDINPRQLEGVQSEADKYENSFSVESREADILRLNMNRAYDAGTMRMVLNYMTKEQIPAALRNISNAMKPGGVFVDCAMAAFTPEQQIFFNQYRYPSSDRIVFEGDYAQRYIPTLGELQQMHTAAFGNCFLSGSVRLDQSSRNVSERFHFTALERESMESEWLQSPEKARNELRMRRDAEGILHYDWWNVILVSIKGTSSF